MGTRSDHVAVVVCKRTEIYPPDGGGVGVGRLLELALAKPLFPLLPLLPTIPWQWSLEPLASPVDAYTCKVSGVPATPVCQIRAIHRLAPHSSWPLAIRVVTCSSWQPLALQSCMSGPPSRVGTT